MSWILGKHCTEVQNQNFYSSTFLIVVVKKKQNAFQKIRSVKERHNNYHFPPFLSFSKRHSIQVQKTSLCILSNNCIHDALPKLPYLKVVSYEQIQPKRVIIAQSLGVPIEQ